MLARVSKWLVVLTLTFSLGAHWLFLQSVAWAGMVVSYSHNTSLPKAFSKTFDGKHPCSLCKLVQEGKAAEKKQDAHKSETKIDKSLPAARSLTLCPPAFEPTLFSGPDRSDSRIEPPPTPPPKRA